MNELFKKSFFEFVSSVVVQRWEEVLLLAGLHGGLVFVMMELMGRMKPDGSGMDPGAGFFVMVIGVAFAVIVNMLVYGFMRSVALVGCERLQPVTLLRIGRSVFWRMIWVEILLGLITVILFSVFASLVGAVLQVGKDDIAGQLRAGGIGMFFSLFCLMKFRLVVSGMIFVKNCSVREAFGGMRDFRLGDGGKMLLFYGFSLAVVSGASYLLQVAVEGGQDTLVYSAFNGLVIGVCGVFWGLCAVWFVGRESETQKSEPRMDTNEH